MTRLAILAALGLLLATGPGGAARQSRVLWQGPVLAGDRIAWIETSGGKGSVHVWSPRGERIVHRSSSLAVTRPFAASRTLLAFERSYPGCPPPAGHVCPDGADAVVGPLNGGRFRPLTNPHTCFLPDFGTALALERDAVAYVELDCSAQRLRVKVRESRGARPRTLRDAPITDGCCRDVALAGRYAAWSERRGVVVYDRVARRVAYRVPVGPGGINSDLGFDLQADGKLAVAFRVIEFAAAGPTAIAWLSRNAPRLHMLPFSGKDTRIRIANDRIAFERFLSDKRSTLVLAGLRGGTRAIAPFADATRLSARFDLDARNVVWAADRITSRRVDCPPPPQGRPCVRRLSGVTSVWRRALAATRATLIARFRFEDASAR